MTCVHKSEQLVYTLKDKCRVCYTCVRECPVKAIKIINGQAEILPERCIACGNCVKVCSQGAKTYRKSIEEVSELLKSDVKTAVCLAPSFAAEFTDIGDYRVLAGMMRKLGFDYVTEVAFGADLVALEYKKLLGQEKAAAIISSDCPAIVNYIEKYHPDIVHALAKVVSPMVTMSRVLHQKKGEEIKIVFIGPCIAKKEESSEIDYSLTFAELRQIFNHQNITPDSASASDFDPPHAGKGSIFPVSRGLLQNLDMQDDITEGNTVVAQGRIHFKDVIEEFENNVLDSKHIELLCCEGCIMGPGMSPGGKRFLRRDKLSKYVREKLHHLDEQKWKTEIEHFKNLDLSQKFIPNDQRIQSASEKNIDNVLKSMGKNDTTDHLNCGACGYDTCFDHAEAIVQGLAETEMCLPYTIEKLHDSIVDLNASNKELANTRQALKQSEKLAGMGQLSAGIAHELNNPLGVITMYSNILKEEISPDNPIQSDLNLIVEQSERCKKIVGGLLNFARKNQVILSETNIKDFIQKSIASVVKPARIKTSVISTLETKTFNIDQEQMLQVLTNLEKNAIEAMPDGGELSIHLNENEDFIEIHVKDTGCGISEENMDKIFTPFFTTKPLGKGTGLGLPLIYGIVKMHKGQISVESNANPEIGKTGTTFKIKIPKII